MKPCELFVKFNLKLNQVFFYARSLNRNVRILLIEYRNCFVETTMNRILCLWIYKLMPNSFVFHLNILVKLSESSVNQIPFLLMDTGISERLFFTEIQLTRVYCYRKLTQVPWFFLCKLEFNFFINIKLDFFYYCANRYSTGIIWVIREPYHEPDY